MILMWLEGGFWCCGCGWLVVGGGVTGVLEGGACPHGCMQVTHVRLLPLKKCAFLEYSSQAEAEVALREMQGFNLMGNRLRLNFGFGGGRQQCEWAYAFSASGVASFCFSLPMIQPLGDLWMKRLRCDLRLCRKPTLPPTRMWPGSLTRWLSTCTAWVSPSRRRSRTCRRGTLDSSSCLRGR